MAFEVQQDGTKKWLKVDNAEVDNMLKMLEAFDAEEIILGDQCATFEGMDEKGNVIMHMEDVPTSLCRQKRSILSWVKTTMMTRSVN